MGLDDGQELILDQVDDRTEGWRIAFRIVVQTSDQVLAGVLDDLRGQGTGGNQVVSLFRQFQRALILELLDDAGLHFGQGTLGVDEVVVENVP